MRGALLSRVQLPSISNRLPPRISARNAVPSSDDAVSAAGNETCNNFAIPGKIRRSRGFAVRFVLDRDHFARFGECVNSPDMTVCYIIKGCVKLARPERRAVSRTVLALPLSELALSRIEPSPESKGPDDASGAHPDIGAGRFAKRFQRLPRLAGRDAAGVLLFDPFVPIRPP